MGQFYLNAEKYLDQIDSGAWVEIGIDRGEGSTGWFSDMTKAKGVNFYAVDIDPEQITRALTVVYNNQVPEHVRLENTSGEKFLSSFRDTYSQSISLAYLDNFDWNYWVEGSEPGWVLDIAQRYQQKFNITMNNLNSQISHLLQATALIPLLTPKSLVICDDTWFVPEQGVFNGKCSAAVPFLLGHGLKPLEVSTFSDGCGVILGKFDS